MVKYYKKYKEDVTPESTPADSVAPKTPEKPLLQDKSIFTVGSDIKVKELSAEEAEMVLEDSDKAIKDGDINPNMTESVQDSNELSKLEENVASDVWNFIKNNNTNGLKNGEIADLLVNALHGNKGTYQTILSKNKNMLQSCQIEYQKATGDTSLAARPTSASGNIPQQVASSTIASTPIAPIPEEPVAPREFTDEEKRWMKSGTSSYSSEAEEKAREEYEANGGKMPTKTAMNVEDSFGQLHTFVKDYLLNVNPTKRLHIILGGPGIGKTVEIFNTIAEIVGKDVKETTKTLKAGHDIIFNGELPYYWQSSAQPEHIRYMTGVKRDKLEDAIVTLFNNRKDCILILDDCDAWIRQSNKYIPPLFKAVFNTSEMLDKVSWRQEDLKASNMDEGLKVTINKDKLKESVLEVTINGETFTEELSKKHALRWCEAMNVEVKPNSWLALHEALDDDELDDDAAPVFNFNDSDPADDGDVNPAQPKPSTKGSYDDDYAIEQAYMDDKLGGKKNAKASSAIPEEFYFQSRILFISNASSENINNAVLTRAKSLDMGTFTAEEFFERLLQILPHLGSIDNLIKDQKMQDAIRAFTRGFLFRLIFATEEISKQYADYGLQSLPVASRQFRAISDFISTTAATVDEYMAYKHPTKLPGESDEDFNERIVLEATNPLDVRLGGTNPRGRVRFRSIVNTLMKVSTED